MHAARTVANEYVAASDTLTQLDQRLAEAKAAREAYWRHERKGAADRLIAARANPARLEPWLPGHAAAAHELARVTVEYTAAERRVAELDEVHVLAAALAAQAAQ